MEVALSPHFLGSAILFSLTSNFEKNFKNEMWLCHKYMDLTMDEIYRMTVMDRKDFISIHNKIVEREKQRLENTMHKKRK